MATSRKTASRKEIASAEPLPDLVDGYLTVAEYNQALRDLQRNYRDEVRSAAEEQELLGMTPKTEKRPEGPGAPVPRLLGFVVSGRPNKRTDNWCSDTFELCQAAVECARRLKAKRWVGITCEELTEVDGQRRLKTLQWEAP